MREALHERHTHHDSDEGEEQEEGLAREGKLAERAPDAAAGTSAKFKSLSWNFPTSSEPTELKETASVKVRPRG